MKKTFNSSTISQIQKIQTQPAVLKERVSTLQKAFFILQSEVQLDEQERKQIKEDLGKNISLIYDHIEYIIQAFGSLSEQIINELNQIKVEQKENVKQSLFLLKEEIMENIKMEQSKQDKSQLQKQSEINDKIESIIKRLYQQDQNLLLNDRKSKELEIQIQNSSKDQIQNNQFNYQKYEELDKIIQDQILQQDCSQTNLNSELENIHHVLKENHNSLLTQIHSILDSNSTSFSHLNKKIDALTIKYTYLTNEIHNQIARVEHTISKSNY